jgi:hypothetical protein
MFPSEHIGAAHEVDIPGYTQFPPPSQSVAPHAPVVVQAELVEQQWPTPVAPQMPLEHSALDMHIPPSGRSSWHVVPGVQ